MASGWNRGAPYGGGSGYMGSGVVGGVSFYMGAPPPADRRVYNTPPPAKTFYGGYRDDNYNRRTDRRDEFRGGKRGPKGRSPDKRYHDAPANQRKDHRPFGKRQSSAGRYEVKLPKGLFNIKSSVVSDLRHKYPRLNVATDFYSCTSPWVESYPLHAPFTVGTGADFHVFHRDVDPIEPFDHSLLEPADADYSYSARVMLMACPQQAELFRNTCNMADDLPNSDKVLPTKNIHFLVGGRAKSETMALGGPWSPSLDGNDPQGNPKTLINTAIRTFKGLTGFDLSPCTEWIKFMELKYYRIPNTKAPAFTGSEEERDVTEKPEVVVFFIPNVVHLIPPESKWLETKEYYSNILQKLLAQEETKASGEQEQVENSVAETSVDEQEDVQPHGDLEPTHYSKLDVNALKVSDLRNELASRKLDSKGLKVNLVARLQAALDEEKRAEEPEETKSEQAPKVASPIANEVKDNANELSEKERRRLERLYRLGDKPAIVIHPNRSARGGRFDCHRVSLFSLLDYRTEDQKEHNFEVSLFAEQFHEMLQRDAAFTIFKAIYNAPDKSESDTKLENGIDEEPENKRRRNDSITENECTEDGMKIRKLKRTVDPELLFAFTYYDMGRCGYIREHDLSEILHQLGLSYSKGQIKMLINKVSTRRDVHYHSLTDSDVVEGSDKDVVTMHVPVNGHEKNENARLLALGNRALFGEEDKQIPAKIVLGGDQTRNLLERVEHAEKIKQSLEDQFYQIKNELEKTRVKLNSFKDTEDELCAQNKDLSARLKTEQKQLHEYKSLSNTYGHLLRTTRDQMDRLLFDINKQFDKEKAKREAEKAAVDAEKTKTDGENAKTDENEDEVKVEEKEWEVVDAV